MDKKGKWAKRMDKWVKQQKEEEFKATILILVWTFLIIGVGLALLVGEIIISFTSLLTCFIIGLWKYIKIYYG